MAAFIHGIPVLKQFVTWNNERVGHQGEYKCKSETRRGSAMMVARPENEPDASISATVEKLYDTYPFPPETLLDEAPLGYNWRWHYPSVHAFCCGYAPPKRSDNLPLRILDAGCGTGESTSFLVYMNPDAEVCGIDLSSGALEVAKERIRRSLPDQADRCSFRHLSIFDVADIDGTFDYINCVGVIHHTPDPLRALRALAAKLRPGGLMHIFVYGAHGRWEISLMQKALRLLRSEGSENNGSSSLSPTSPAASFESGVALGRRVFAALPDGNRLKTRERDRWAQENQKDATFADMYLHPQEIDYDVPTLFDLIDSSGLEFVAFSNPRTWDLSRIFGTDELLLASASNLPDREQYRLVELLDPEAITHFEFFLSKPPSEKIHWSDDEQLSAAAVTMSDCLFGWPSKVIMDRDYIPFQLTDDDYSFLQAVSNTDSASPISVADAKRVSDISFDRIRYLSESGIVLLTPL